MPAIARVDVPSNPTTPNSSIAASTSRSRVSTLRGSLRFAIYDVFFLSNQAEAGSVTIAITMSGAVLRATSDSGRSFRNTP